MKNERRKRRAELEETGRQLREMSLNGEAWLLDDYWQFVAGQPMGCTACKDGRKLRLHSPRGEVRCRVCQGTGGVRLYADGTLLAPAPSKVYWTGRRVARHLWDADAHFSWPSREGHV